MFVDEGNNERAISRLIVRVEKNGVFVPLQIMDHVMAGIEDILGKHGNYHVRDKYA